MYALNLDENGRILSVTLEKYAPKDATLVETLPDGNVADYLYVEGEYVYDPLPEPEQPEQPEDLSVRVQALEDQLAAYEAAYQEGVNEA